MSEQPPDLVQRVMLATWNARYLKAEQRAIAAIAAVRAYDEANMARADEPDTHDVSPPVTGWEQF